MDSDSGFLLFFLAVVTGLQNSQLREKDVFFLEN